MTISVETMSHALARADLTRVARFLVERNDLALDLADRVVTEYRRFIAIRLAHPDAAISPSKLVDEAWHHHLLDSPRYVAFCHRVNDGQYIHHSPFLRDDEPVGAPSVRRTLMLYREMFGSPDTAIWPMSADCTASCGDCSSSDCGPRCT